MRGFGLRSRRATPRGSLACAGFASAICLLLVVAGGVLAQQGDEVRDGGYDLSWWTVDGGGGAASSGPGYLLGGTVGQPDAGVLSGPGYTLTGGFWQGAAGIYRVYLPLVVRSYP
jgi:hypothetical protein